MSKEIIGEVGTVATIMVFLIGGWVQVNSRISMLEVQVKNDHEMFLNQSQKLDDMSKNIEEIKNQVVELRGDLKLKQDKFKANYVLQEN